VSSYGATGNGATDDSAAFEKAVQIAASEHGYVFVPAPRVAYRISHPVQLESGVAITAGAAKPTIVGGVAKGYVFRLRNVTGASVSCLTLNLGHLDHASGIQVSGSSDITLSNLNIENVTQGWGINIGTSDPNSTANSNTDVTVSGASFAGFDSHFEEIILVNSSDLTVSRCTFGSAVFHPSGGGLGLYQNDDRVTVTGNTFGPGIGNTGVYYSISVDNVTFENNTFIGDGSASKGNTGIKGANVSDHGVFGQSSVANYVFTKNTFKDLRTALQLGALDSASVSGNQFVGNQVGIQVDGGNSFKVHLQTPDRAVTVEANQFTSNGTSIAFKGTGALQGVSVSGNDFGTSTSSPIVFSGRQTWTGLSVTNNSYAGSPSDFISLANGAKLGPAAAVGGN
jgi:Pectate lyase superfamily protein